MTVAGSTAQSRPPGSSRRIRVRAAGLMLVLILLASCKGGAGQSSLPPVLPTTPPAQGDLDSVVWDLPLGEPISLDPLQAYGYSESSVLGNACEALLSLAPDFSFQPRLAQSVRRVSPNIWDYRLREGVKFWDGKPMTAADVVFSIQRHLDPANGSYYLEPFALDIKAVQEVDPLTVRIVTKTPSVIINEMMATGLGTIGEADYIKRQGKSYGTPQGGLMCTGPFEFGSWKPGQSITLKRNDSYWDPARVAHTKQIEFKFITDLSLLTNALISGEIDGSYEAPATSIGQLQKADGAFYLGPAVNNVALLLTLPAIQGPLKDIRVRQALSLAMDRQGIAQTVYSGAAEPLKSTLILPITYPFAADRFAAAYSAMPDASQNLDQAKQLVKDSGVQLSRPLVLAIQAEDPRSTQTANSIVDSAKQIGLPMVIKQLPGPDFDNLYFDPTAREPFDLILGDNWGDFADPLEFLAFAALPGPQNFTNYRNTDVTRLYYAAQNTGDDQEKRADLTIQAVEAFQKDLQIMPLLYTPERLYMDSRITGARATFPYQYDTWAGAVGAGAFSG